mmetsp:Transcript_5071/g.13636  ORF Transcript_5071/g.13636 Transcript_5071/m.13636 type:complete len:237 (+) Transcript_5071:902-1612(+)
MRKASCIAASSIVSSSSCAASASRALSSSARCAASDLPLSSSAELISSLTLARSSSHSLRHCTSMSSLSLSYAFNSSMYVLMNPMFFNICSEFDSGASELDAAASCCRSRASMIFASSRASLSRRGEPSSASRDAPASGAALLALACWRGSMERRPCGHASGLALDSFSRVMASEVEPALAEESGRAFLLSRNPTAQCRCLRRDVIGKAVWTTACFSAHVLIFLFGFANSKQQALR